jgi:hypothetical protein
MPYSLGEDKERWSWAGLREEEIGPFINIFLESANYISRKDQREKDE